jgi:hypothetical protein
MKIDENLVNKGKKFNNITAIRRPSQLNLSYIIEKYTKSVNHNLTGRIDEKNQWLRT